MSASQDPTAEGQISENDNLSMEAFIAARLQEDQPEEESPEESTEESDDLEPLDENIEEAEEEEETEEEQPEGEEESEQTGEIDLLELAPEQIQALATKAKSRLLKDVGKLRAENRIMAERLASLETQGQKKAKDIPTEANPFGNLQSMDDIQAKADELEQTLEVTDRLLEEYEDYGPDDIIQVGQEPFTKKQIRIANRNARDSITKFLPAQQKHVVKMMNLAKGSEVYRAQAEKEVPEITDEKTEIGKNYRILVSDPLVKQVKEKLPELGFQMEYILAHAARSIFGKGSKIPAGAGSKLKVKLPASPVSSSGIKGSSQKSKVDSALARYEKTGSQADWQAYRLAQMGQ